MCKAQMDGGGDLTEALAKARDLVSNMTLEEKVVLTTGGTLGNGCHGAIEAIGRVNFPGMCLCDAGNGLRATDYVSSYPSGIHVGARYVHSWG